MEVILLERVGRLGSVGDVVKVKNGFGRNFLLPQKKALRATDENKKVFEGKRADIEAANAKARDAAQAQAKKMENVSVTLVRQASEDGKLYGSVNSRDVAEALQAQGHSVDRKQVVVASTIKNTGNYTVTLTLHPEVVLSVPLNVVRSEAEAEEVPEELRAPVEEDAASDSDANAASAE